MNFNTLTQEELDRVWNEYHELAFGLKLTYRETEPLERFKDYIGNRFCGSDGYRLGISGWEHTKLRIKVDVDGHMIFNISPNADKLNKEQKKIIKTLETWAKGLSNRE